MSAINIALIPLLPLASFLLLGLFGKKYFAKSGGIIGTLSLTGSAVLSLWTAFNYFLVEIQYHSLNEYRVENKLLALLTA